MPFLERTVWVVGDDAVIAAASGSFYRDGELLAPEAYGGRLAEAEQLMRLFTRR